MYTDRGSSDLMEASGPGLLSWCGNDPTCYKQSPVEITLSTVDQSPRVSITGPVFDHGRSFMYYIKCTRTACAHMDATTGVCDDEMSSPGACGGYALIRRNIDTNAQTVLWENDVHTFPGPNGFAKSTFSLTFDVETETAFWFAQYLNQDGYGYIVSLHVPSARDYATTPVTSCEIHLELYIQGSCGASGGSSWGGSSGVPSVHYSSGIISATSTVLTFTSCPTGAEFHSVSGSIVTLDFSPCQGILYMVSTKSAYLLCLFSSPFAFVHALSHTTPHRDFPSLNTQANLKHIYAFNPLLQDAVGGAMNVRNDTRFAVASTPASCNGIPTLYDCKILGFVVDDSGFAGDAVTRLAVPQIYYGYHKDAMNFEIHKTPATRNANEMDVQAGDTLLYSRVVYEMAATGQYLSNFAIDQVHGGLFVETYLGNSELRSVLQLPMAPAVSGQEACLYGHGSIPHSRLALGNRVCTCVQYSSTTFHALYTYDIPIQSSSQTFSPSLPLSRFLRLQVPRGRSIHCKPVRSRAPCLREDSVRRWIFSACGRPWQQHAHARCICSRRVRIPSR